jgi:sirohydrochlorin ferrochelatase
MSRGARRTRFPGIHDPRFAYLCRNTARDDFERIIVLPMFIARGGHLRRDVPALLDELQNRYPRACFEQASAIGEVETVVQAMALHALGLAGHATIPDASSGVERPGR